MSRKRSLAQRQLDDSSSDDGCSMILSAGQILLLSKVIELFTVTEKAAIIGCIKIIWLRIQHMVQNYSVEGFCTLISD